MAGFIETIFNPGPVVKGYEGSTQAFYAGDPVYMTNTGQWIVATDGKIDGIARKNASGTSNTVLEVELLSADAIYSIPYTASATAVTLIGDAVGLSVTTQGGTYVYDTDSTKEFKVVGLDPRDSTGTSGGRLYVQILPAYLLALGD